MGVVRHPALFRLLAIVGDTERFNAVLDLARDIPQISLGIMLRDPQHDASRVRMLGEYALQVTIPENVTLVSNAISISGIPIVHRTSEQLHHAAGEGASIQTTDSATLYGVSVHSLEEALMAETLGATYMTFSPVFPTASKPGDPGAGISELKRVSAGVSIPVLALGGIDAGNAWECIEAGAYGIAGISLFAPQNRTSCQRVIELLQQ
jgi:thiamine-phosphate pyrophosphorylase